MALEKREASNKPSIDGYLNISITDKEGEVHRVGKFGVQLSDERLVDRSILNKFRDLKEGEGVDLSITATVALAGVTAPATDLPL